MKRTDYRHTLVVMVGLAAASLTGYLRQAALAHQLGAGRAADVYLVAGAVPEFVFVALPIVVAPAFIPLFAERRQAGGEYAAWRFGVHVAAALLAVLFLLTIVGELAAPIYLRWLAPGFDAKRQARAVHVSRLMLPAVGLMGLATLAGATLQVYGRFARPSLATGLYNLVFIAVLLGVPWGGPLDRAGWGVVLGAAAALLLQVPLLWRHRPAGKLLGLDTPRDKLGPLDRHSAGEASVVRRSSDPEHRCRSSAGLSVSKGRSEATYRDQDTLDGCSPSPSLKTFARLIGPLLAGYAIHHLILFVDRAMATSLGAGRAAALNYAYHLALIVGQLSGLAVSTAVFPRLAEQIAEGDKAGTCADLSDALGFVWAIGLPAAAGLIVLRRPIVAVLFEHGAFDRTATAAVTGPLGWYALAVLADAFCQPLWRVVYARRSAGFVVGVNGLQTGLRWGANVALMPIFGYHGLAISALIGLSVQAVLLGWLARRWLGTYLALDWWRDAARVVLGTGAALAPAPLLTALQPADAPAWLEVLTGVAAAVTIYGVALWLLNYRRRSWFEDWANTF